MTNPLINTKNLPAYTTTGSYLGRVVAVEIDPIKNLVINYQVATPLTIFKLWHKCLIISSEQVVSLTPQALLVDDRVKKSYRSLSKNPNLVIEPTQ